MQSLFLLIIIVCLVLSSFSSPGGAQGTGEAAKLYEEAQALDSVRGALRSPADIKAKYIQALDAFERLGDKKRVADLGVSLAHMYGVPEAKKAIQLYERSLAYYKELNDRKSEATTLKALATICYQSKDYAKAEAYSEQALTAFRELKDRPDEAWTLIWLAHLHRRAARYDKAVEFYQKGIAIDSELGDKEKGGIALMSLAGTYGDSGQHEKAVESFEKLITNCRELKNLSCEADALQGLVRVYNQWGKPEKASEYNQRLRMVVEQIMGSGRKPVAK